MQVWKLKQEGTQAEKAFIQPTAFLSPDARQFVLLGFFFFGCCCFLFFSSSTLVGLKLAGSILVTC